MSFHAGCKSTGLWHLYFDRNPLLRVACGRSGNVTRPFSFRYYYINGGMVLCCRPCTRTYLSSQFVCARYLTAARWSGRCAASLGRGPVAFGRALQCTDYEACFHCDIYNLTSVDIGQLLAEWQAFIQHQHVIVPDVWLKFP